MAPCIIKTRVETKKLEFSAVYLRQSATNVRCTNAAQNIRRRGSTLIRKVDGWTGYGVTSSEASRLSADVTENCYNLPSISSLTATNAENTSRSTTV